MFRCLIFNVFPFSLYLDFANTLLPDDSMGGLDNDDVYSSYPEQYMEGKLVIHDHVCMCSDIQRLVYPNFRAYCAVTVFQFFCLPYI